jgi:uncharacterized protein YndB with AHSA1/START domain
MKITVETTIAAPLETIWQCWTTPRISSSGTAPPDWHTTRAEVDLRVGGTFSSRMEARMAATVSTCRHYTRIEAPQLIECQFGDRSLLVEFLPGADGVTVRETFDAETVYPVEQQRAGWQAILDNFARHVSSK